MSDEALIGLLLVAVPIAMAIKVWRNQRYRKRLIADFLADTERKERQGC